MLSATRRGKGKYDNIEQEREGRGKLHCVVCHAFNIQYSNSTSTSMVTHYISNSKVAFYGSK